MPGTTGIAPARDLIALLEEIGYAGPVTPYPHPSQFKRTARDSMVAQTSEALKSVWAASIPIEDQEGETDEPEQVGSATEATAGSA